MIKRTILFGKNSVGQRVHSADFGNGTIFSYEKERSYPILVKFDIGGRIEQYTALGQYWLWTQSTEDISPINTPINKDLTPQEMIKQGTEMVQRGLDLLAGQ